MKRILFVLLLSNLLFSEVKADAPGPDVKPVHAWGASACQAFVIFILFSNGKLVVLTEAAGIPAQDIDKALGGVPVEVRHFKCGVSA